MVAGKKSISQNFVILLLLASLGLNFFYFFKYSWTSFKFPPPGSLFSHPGGVQDSGGALTSRVTKVIDGDTFDLADGTRIRLAYIDAPEYQEECYSYDAKVKLEELVLNKDVRIEPIEKDNFGRTVAGVFLNDVLINEILLREGAAEIYHSKTVSAYDLQLEKAESEAKSLGKGMWSDACANKLNPNCQIKANARRQNDTKIYHLPGCQNYERVVVDEKRGDRWFCTEEEAVVAGFTRSKACP